MFGGRSIMLKPSRASSQRRSLTVYQAYRAFDGTIKSGWTPPTCAGTASRGEEETFLWWRRFRLWYSLRPTLRDDFRCRWVTQTRCIIVINFLLICSPYKYGGVVSRTFTFDLNNVFFLRYGWIMGRNYRWNQTNMSSFN